MATTTNYGWTTPDDTDLVKDGAAAIRTLGSSVDTTTKALNPETTEGDIAYRSATANTNTRLALGTAGQVLTVNSGEDAPEWASPSSASGPTFSAKSTTPQTISASTFTKVTYGAEEWDTASNFASDRFTPTTSGYYQINVSIEFASAANFTTRTQLRKNGSSWNPGYTSIGAGVANPIVRANCLVFMNGSSDYLEVFGWSNSTGTVQFYESYFDGIWIRS
jgi:hypothetical protein